MNALVTMNYVIFAIVVSLFILELGVALVSFIDYSKYKNRIMTYIAPVWEITGTFSVFYLVNLAATFPGALPVIDTLYVGPVLLAALALITRDAFLGFSELTGENWETKWFFRIYGVLTVVTMFLLFSVLSSSLSGAAVNLASLAMSPVQLALNPFNIMLFVSVLLLALSCSVVVLGIKPWGSWLDTAAMCGLMALSVLVLFTGLWLYVPYVIADLASAWYLAVPVIVLFLIMLFVYVKDGKYPQVTALAFLIYGIFAFELIEYPSLFGQAVNVMNYITVPPISTYVLVVSALGCVFLAAALGFFAYVRYRDEHPRPTRMRKPLS